MTNSPQLHHRLVALRANHSGERMKNRHAKSTSTTGRQLTTTQTLDEIQRFQFAEVMGWGLLGTRMVTPSAKFVLNGQKPVAHRVPTPRINAHIGESFHGTHPPITAGLQNIHKALIINAQQRSETRAWPQKGTALGQQKTQPNQSHMSNATNENNGRGELAIGNPTLFTLARFTGYQPKSDRRRRPRRGVPFVVVRFVGPINRKAPKLQFLDAPDSDRPALSKPAAAALLKPV